MSKKIKAYKVTLAGSYKGHDDKVFDYSDLTGFVPYNAPEVAKQCIYHRFAPMWILQNPEKYKERLKRIREVFGHETLEDDVVMVPVETFSYIGKDIKKMNFEELQQLSAANDLRKVPLFNKTSLRAAQEVAYVEYSEKVLRKPIDRKDPKFNYSKLPALVVGADIHTDKSEKITNEEMIEREQNIRDLTSTEDTTLTVEDLRAMADEKGIYYHPNTGRAKLYKMLFGGVIPSEVDEEAA
jgi:hypothetical protein